MMMPRAGGYRSIVQGRCSLSAYVEGRRLQRETRDTIAAYIFEDILCQWGAVGEIVTDNGSPFIKALEVLGKRYKIFNIRISAYNSKANGFIERAHRPVREALIKAADGVESKWLGVFHSVMWAERVTIQGATGFSPYRIVHGVDLLFPFDLAEATYLVPLLDTPMTTAELLAIRAWQLQKREEDLEKIEERVMKSRKESAEKFMAKFSSLVKDFDFEPGAMVLVRNSAVEKELNQKSKPRYLGPMVVVKRTERGAYVLAELNGAISCLTFAAFCLVPYYAQTRATQPITLGEDDIVDEDAADDPEEESDDGSSEED
jgi:hypothetical protein